MKSPRDVIAGYVGAFEGGLSLHPSDNGNWYSQASYTAGLPQKRGVGTLVGSMRGVTAYALIAYRRAKGVKLPMAAKVSQMAMASITLDIAVNIGLTMYFVAPGFNKLAWNRVTASILDKAWGSGPKRAILMMQDMLAMPSTGRIDADTVTLYAKALADYGEEEMAARWADKRLQFDHQLATNGGPNDPDAAFLNGWNNRTRSFLPGSTWWKAMAA